MSTTDNIYFRKKGSDRFLTGIGTIVKVIEASYGPTGSNVIVQDNLYPYHVVTNDGKSIVDKIVLDDPIENIGANFIREAGDKADKDSGDGRKTTMILVNAILKEAAKHTHTPLDVKKSLDECLPIIIKNLDEQTKKIKVNGVAQVASIAAENEEIGRILQEIYTTIGFDGIVELDNSNTFDTFYTIQDGVRFRNAGFLAPYMVTEEGKAIYKKPKILITKQKISTLQDIDPIFQVLSKNGTNEVVIYCDEIDPQVLSALAFTHIKGIFKTLIIKSPTLWKDWFFEDFAKVTGATVVDLAMTGLTLKDVQLEHLGTCDKLITTKEETTVIGIQDVSNHIKKLLADNTDESKLRASWLQTKAAVLKLGANSESELSYISKKARDGRNAAFLALKGGVVPGAGMALKNTCKDLPETKGGKILKEVLVIPISILRDNLEDAYFIPDKNIVDPALVVKNAITNAISIAGTALTARTVISLPAIKEKHENFQQMPSM